MFHTHSESQADAPAVGALMRANKYPGRIVVLSGIMRTRSSEMKQVSCLSFINATLPFSPYV